MIEMVTVISAVLCGGLLGLMFFGGLWWTLRRMPSARQPHLLMLGSSVLRMSMALAGFYICVRVGLTALLGCLAGFVGMRLWLTRKLRDAVGPAGAQERCHAP